MGSKQVILSGGRIYVWYQLRLPRTLLYLPYPVNTHFRGFCSDFIPCCGYLRGSQPDQRQIRIAKNRLSNPHFPINVYRLNDSTKPYCLNIEAHRKSGITPQDVTFLAIG